tara:strand:- start:187 stop:453 length:267 start_codon:yes stop_codon:yes gene_type:complete
LYKLPSLSRDTLRKSCARARHIERKAYSLSVSSPALAPGTSGRAAAFSRGMPDNAFALAPGKSGTRHRPDRCTHCNLNEQLYLADLME